MSAATVDVVFGLCQTSPVHRDADASIRAVDTLLSGIERSRLDTLVLPELAFVGYAFDSPDAIKPFLEEQDGPTFHWAKRTALRLDCVVCVGFAERGDDGRRYNSQLTVSAQGALVNCYRKTHLYEADLPWATAGAGFERFNLPLPARPDRPSCSIVVVPAICMDLNPAEFRDWHAFELARYVESVQPGAIIVSNAWLDSDRGASSNDGDERLHRYWLARLEPLLGGNSIALAICNRVGREGDSTYAGSSMVADLATLEIAAAASKRGAELAIGTLAVRART